MNLEITDCVVLGGGPAGSTFAAIASKHAPDAKVVVLEQARFPRGPSGEPTLPAASSVLEDLGIHDERLAPDGSRLDERLLANCRKLGADVREGTRATVVRRVGKGPSHVITWEDDRGRKGRILTDFVLDATGLSHLMTKGERQHAQDLEGFAVFGYLRGAQWEVDSGPHDASTVFIAAVEKGWIWYLPLGPDLMTVGVVTNPTCCKHRPQDVELETFFWEMLRSCPEVADLVADATLRDDILPNGARVSACQDWSSWARNPVGEGWAAAGDAAMLVDPMLSTGVTLALQSGHRAAHTWLTARARPELPAAELWRAYADHLRGEHGPLLGLVWVGARTGLRGQPAVVSPRIVAAEAEAPAVM